MSQYLRDLANRKISNASKLMQKGKHKEALVELQEAEEAARKTKANDILLRVLSTKRDVMQTLGAYDEALKVYALILKTTEEILSKDPDNELYHSIFWTNLDAIKTLGNLLYNSGRFNQAKKCYEMNLSISQKLLQVNPENVAYYSYVGTMLNNLGALLSNIGRYEEAKQRYEEALEICKKLLKTNPKNVVYQSDTAMALSNLGTLLWNIGRFEEAKNREEKTLKIYEKLLKKDPENVEYQSYVGTTLKNFGGLLSDMGRIEEAKQRYEKALEIFEKLLKKDPKNVKYQSEMAMTLNSFSSLLSDMGRIKEAKQRYEKALGIFEELLETDPENVAYQSYVGTMINTFSSLFSNMGCFEEKKQKYEKALEMKEKLLKEDPENLVYQSVIAKMLYNLGLLLSNISRFEEAKQRYEKALEILEKLLKRDPENVKYQSDMAITLNNLGALLYNKGSFKEAKQRYEKALDIYKELLKVDPENVKYQLNIAKNLHNFGELLSNTGRLIEAKQRYEEALEICKKLLKADPENVKYQLNVTTTLNNFGSLLSDMGRFEKAKQRYEKALEMKEKLLKTDPENVTYQLDMAITLNNLGALLSDMGRVGEAKQRKEKALEIFEELLKTDPENVTYQSYVGGSLNNFGALLSDMGRFEKAKQTYEKALEMKEKLFKKDPENVRYQSDVGTTLNNLGALLFEMGHSGEAKQRYERTLEIYEKLLESDSENVRYQSYIGTALNNLGNLLSNISRFEEAKQRYEKALEMREKLLKTDYENVRYQSDFGAVLNNLGALLYNKCNIEEAKQRYQKALETREKLLKMDPENLVYQSDVGTTLNNLGTLLYNEGSIKEAKQQYERALEIYTEPMQYLTIGKKSNSIIRFIQLNTEQAETETNDYRKIKYLEEAYKLCKMSQAFLSKYELKHEKKLVVEAGLSAYLEYVIIDIKGERRAEKRSERYEKAIQAFEKFGKIGNDEEFEKIASSTIYYLKGRKLVNEALGSEQLDLELIEQAVNLFKDAKEINKKANVCYYIYIGLLKILENVEIFEEKDGLKAKEMINHIIETLPEEIDQSIRTAFEEIKEIFETNNIKSRKDHLEEFDKKIRTIESVALENIFGYVLKKLKDYIEEPFSPNLLYENWKLRVVFDDPQKVKGKLIIKTGNQTLLNRILTQEEIKSHILEIDYLDNNYFPQGEDEISFTTTQQKKSVIRSIDYFESIIGDNKIRILLHDCSENEHLTINQKLNIAVVQLKYNVYIENSVVKIKEDDAYYKKVMNILENIANEANIVVFPEFSIPFDYIKDIQNYANKNQVLVVAGSHYVLRENLEKYKEHFNREFNEKDLQKNISPIIIPCSKIIHNEKYLGAEIEDPCFFTEGMTPGNENHIFKLRNDLTLGVMICFEYAVNGLRYRILPVCDIILVPQTNPDPGRFYTIAEGDMSIPFSGKNIACIMANGIFTVDDDKKISGGSSGALLIDKNSYKNRSKGIISQVGKNFEQFIYLLSIDTKFYAARSTQTGHGSAKGKLIHIFEESEILKDPESNGKRFINLLETIEKCDNSDELKRILTNEKNKEIINIFSPLMHEHIQNLNQLTLDQMKKKCLYAIISVK